MCLQGQPENGVLWCQQTERLSVGSEMDQYCIVFLLLYLTERRKETVQVLISLIVY